MSPVALWRSGQNTPHNSDAHFHTKGLLLNYIVETPRSILPSAPPPTRKLDPFLMRHRRQHPRQPEGADQARGFRILQVAPGKRPTGINPHALHLFLSVEANGRCKVRPCFCSGAKEQRTVSGFFLSFSKSTNRIYETTRWGAWRPMK